MNKPLVLLSAEPGPLADPPCRGAVVARSGPADGPAASSGFSRPVRYVGGPAEAGEADDAVDRLLDDSWDERLVSYPARQRVAGAVLSAAFIAAAVLLALLAPAVDPLGSPGMIAAMALGFAIASRVEFPIGAGYAVPTQLFLVPLFVLAPPALVPLIVLGAMTAATLVDIARRGVKPDRIVDVGVDSWHSFAPALVFTVAGVPDVAEAAVWLFILAFAAQVVSEVTTSSLRVWWGLGISPQLQLMVLGPIWAIDLVLSPIAFVAANAVLLDGLSLAPLSLLGFVLLLAFLTRDRTLRINQAHDRLEALRSERSRLEVAVQRIGDAFASKLDLDALLNITMRAAVEALDADGARASAHPGAGRQLVRRAKTREQPELEPAMVRAEQACAASGDVATAMVDGIYAIACPLREPVADTMVGVIVLARRAVDFTERKRELLAYLCEQAGVAAGDIERHATLHRQALTDELTGLANHRRLQELLTAGAEGYHLSGDPLALILFDLDDFKKVNDTRGHQAGDHVLREVSQALRSCCRAGDEAARYGGEELAIVMHASDFNGVLAVAERARAAIEALELLDPEGRDLRVTASVGVAALGPGIRDPQALIAAADAALYEAKHSGKNCVHFHGGTSAI